MEVQETNIPDVLVFLPSIYEDDRGFFVEVYRKDIFNDLGLNEEFVQDNHSKSSKYATFKGFGFGLISAYSAKNLKFDALANKCK